MQVGKALLDAARATGAPSLFVVGIGKNVGKTVTMRAIYEAAHASGLRVGLTSIGRDGEAIDASDALPKPRLFLRPGTMIATARDVLPRSPASEILELSPLVTAAGSLVYARTVYAAHYELIGPPTASGVRAVVNGLLRHAEYAIVDGAVDRVAALAGGGDAVVVACGASAAGTIEEATTEIAALVRRLGAPIVDPRAPLIRIDGALLPSQVAEFVRIRETRQIVVRDPTQIALAGKSALHALDRLTIRCERPIRVVGTTIASIGRTNAFEPRAFLNAVSAATGLPSYDVYAGCAAA